MSIQKAYGITSCVVVTVSCCVHSISLSSTPARCNGLRKQRKRALRVDGSQCFFILSNPLDTSTGTLSKFCSLFQTADQEGETNTAHWIRARPSSCIHMAATSIPLPRFHPHGLRSTLLVHPENVLFPRTRSCTSRRAHLLSRCSIPAHGGVVENVSPKRIFGHVLKAPQHLLKRL